MVFSKPKLYEVHAFDATQPYTFKFSYTGSQAEWNELRIEDANGTTVYKQRVVSRLSSHKIPANTLTNNKNSRYKVYVTVGASQTIDKVTETVSSVESNWVSFYCFDAPVFKLNGLSDKQVINSSTLIFTTIYETAENSDRLNSYEVFLYDANGQLIRASGTIYVSGAVEFEYKLTGLEDDRKYYVEVIGETLNHLVATTKRIVFSVEYVRPSAFATLTPTNLPREGQIKLQSNIISILGKCGPTSRTGVLSDGSPAMPVYINNQEIDITGDGHWVMFDEGFNINGDFTMQIVLRRPNPCSDILIMYDGIDGITGPLISIPAENNPDTEIDESDPTTTDVYDGKYVHDIANPPSANIVPETGWLRGDVNNDGKVNSADENLLYRSVLGYTDLSKDALLAADVNQDGFVDTADVKILHQNIVNPPEWSSAEPQNVITLTYMTGRFAFEVKSDDGNAANDVSYVNAPIVDKAYIALYAHGGNVTYTVLSDYFDTPNPSDYIYIWIQRINNLYTVKTSVRNGGEN